MCMSARQPVEIVEVERMIFVERRVLVTIDVARG